MAKPAWVLLLTGSALVFVTGSLAVVLQGLRWIQGDASYERSAVTIIGGLIFATMGAMGLVLARKRRA